MKYLKLFESHSNYEDFVDGGTMEKPNVSHCVQENEVHYNPIVIMTVRYNVIDASSPKQLYLYNNNIGSFGVNMFDKVVIDGVEVSISDLDVSGGTYLFSTEGEHTVKYTLKDPTLIGIEGDEQTHTITKIGATFMNCSCVESVEIPNSVTSIGNGAFDGCIGLTTVTIPDSVTSIGNNAFCVTNLDAATRAQIKAINENGICEQQPFE